MATVLNDKILRRSQAREDIYAYLCGTKEHPSAEMIYAELSESNPTLSMATLYRNLKQLEELGKVIRVTNVNGFERYDANCEDHVHFVCEKCGRVIDFMDADMIAVKRDCNAPAGVKVRSAQIVLKGICDCCSE